MTARTTLIRPFHLFLVVCWYRPRAKASAWLSTALGLWMSVACVPAFAQRMYASRGSKGITYIMGSPGYYEALLDQFQKDEPTPWRPIDVPWKIVDRFEDLDERDSRSDRDPVATTTICIQVRPSFSRETLIKLREWSDGHADVEVVVPKHRTFWHQLNDPQIAMGTQGPQDLMARCLWAQKTWGEKELPGIKGWIKTFKRLRVTSANPVPSTMACDGIAYRLSAKGGMGLGSGWNLSWTAYNPNENNPSVVWIQQVHKGVQKVIDRDGAFKASLERLDDAGPGWAGYVALRIAMEKKDLSAVQSLLAKGVDPNGPPNVLRVFPLPTSPEILDAVLKAGGRVDLKEAPTQETALHVLLASDSVIPEAETPFLGLLDRLLKAGSDPNAADFDHRTPLILASGRAWPGAIKRLLDHGAQVDAKEVTGRTALHELCASIVDGDRPGEVASAAFLVDRGCPIDAPDGEGWTALAMAFRHERPALWGWLLEHGANPHLRSRDGGTLVHHLVRGRYSFLFDNSPRGRAHLALFEQSLDALLAKGLSLEATDNQGLTPLMVAKQEGNEALARVLIRRGAALKVQDARQPPKPRRKGGPSHGRS